MECAVPVCNNEGRNSLGIRLRRPDGTAIWSPVTDAFLCDLHSSRGLRLTVLLEATDTGKVESITYSVGEPIVRESKIIHTPRER